MIMDDTYKNILSALSRQISPWSVSYNLNILVRSNIAFNFKFILDSRYCTFDKWKCR